MTTSRRVGLLAGLLLGTSAALGAEGSAGQGNVPASNTGFVSAAGGHYHSLGLQLRAVSGKHRLRAQYR